MPSRGPMCLLVRNLINAILFDIVHLYFPFRMYETWNIIFSAVFYYFQVIFFFFLLTAHTVRYDMAALSFICSANWDVTHNLLLKRVNSWRALTFPCCPNILDVFLT